MSDDVAQFLGILGIVIAWPIGFAVFVSALFWAFARIGGWARLAERYPAPEGFAGETFFPGFAIQFGWVSYRGMVGCRALPEGLHLSVPSFVAFHPALLLPWDRIEVKPGSLMPGRAGWLYLDGVAIGVGQPVVDRVQAAQAAKEAK